MRNQIVLIALLLIVPCFSFGKSVEYVVNPSHKYDGIEVLLADIYKTTKKGKIGLIRPNGEEIAECDNDELTGFYDDYALLLKSEGNLRKISGVVKADGTYMPFVNTYYVMDGMEFFSDGLLPVYNKNHDRGYITPTEREAIGFNKRYSRLKPFSEGYAVVYDQNKKFMLISRDGTKQSISLPGNTIGQIDGGTNVYKGKALLWDGYNNKFYNYDVNSGQVSKTKNPGIKDLRDIDDYLYYPSKVSGRPQKYPIQRIPIEEEQIGIYELNSQYGIEMDGKYISPAVFDKVGKKYDGNIIVKTPEGNGIINISNREPCFDIVGNSELITYDKGKSVDCSFTYSCPSEWTDRNFDIKVKDASSDQYLPLSFSDGSGRFSVKPNSDSQAFEIEMVYGDKVMQCKELNYRFKRKESEVKISISIALSTNKADKEDQVPVFVTITNVGEDTANVRIDISGSPSVERVSSTISLAPGKSKQIDAHFNVKERLENQTIYVNASNGAKASKSVEVLLPYY